MYLIPFFDGRKLNSSSFYIENKFEQISSIWFGVSNKLRCISTRFADVPLVNRKVFLLFCLSVNGHWKSQFLIKTTEKELFLSGEIMKHTPVYIILQSVHIVLCIICTYKMSVKESFHWFNTLSAAILL